MKKFTPAIILLFIINYSNAANYYWVGGTGNWSDFGNHWATTSGGLVMQTQTPGPFDDVFFDSSSFQQNNDTVSINVPTAYCNNMDWTGAINNPGIIFSGGSVLKLYGSLTLTANMEFGLGYGGYMRFEATSPGKTITTNGTIINSRMDYFGVGGSWSLNDTLNLTNSSTTGIITVLNGSFHSNNFPINCWKFEIGQSGVINTVDLGSSLVNCSGVFWDYGGGTLVASTTTINCGAFKGASGRLYHDVNCLQYLQCSGATFNDISCVQIQGSGNAFHNAWFNSSGLMYVQQSNIFHKATFINGNVNIWSNCTFDSLMFDIQGHTIQWSAGGSITVNDYLLINSSPAFPTLLNSGSTGMTATIIKNSGTVCLDYVILQDVHATGGALFFAGDHSTNLGNTSGWSFTSCAAAISNVWPGDANYDLIVNNFDLLNIGMAYNDTGFVRAGASLNYVAQPCYDWYYQFVSGVNEKHADCDGNGIVNADDTLAVSLNYGQIHPPRLSQSYSTLGVGPDLSFQMPGTLPPGSIANIPITLSGTISPCYGFAFTINFDPSFIVPGSMSISYAGTVLAPAGNYIHLEKDFYSSGNFDLAFSRINHADTSESGLVATLTFTVANNANGMLNLSFNNIKFIQHQGLEFPVNPHNSSATTGIENINGFLSASFYPNPMTDQATLFFTNADHQNYFLSVRDITGRKNVPVRNTTSNEFIIERKNMQSGIYFYELTNEDHSKNISGKFFVQ